MASGLSTVPASLKQIQHYIKTAVEHDKRDPVVAYYCRIYALQKGMEIDKSSTEGRTFLLSLMDHLEKDKQSMKEDEAITNEVVGQAHVENYALKLFLYADNEDRAARFGKNVVKSFYTAGMLFDVLGQFGELSEDVEKNRKYAKWKAAYIHNCLKNGETPHAGPLDEEGDDGVDPSLAAVPGGASGGVPPQIGFTQPPAGGMPSQPGPPQPNIYNQPSQPSPYSAPTQPYVAPSQPTPIVPPQQPVAPATYTPPQASGSVQLKPQDYQRAMKLCKFASSALQYEDSKTAIDNLTKALTLLSTGHES